MNHNQHYSAAITAIEHYLVTNDDLVAEYPDWNGVGYSWAGTIGRWPKLWSEFRSSTAGDQE